MMKKFWIIMIILIVPRIHSSNIWTTYGGMIPDYYDAKSYKLNGEYCIDKAGKFWASDVNTTGTFSIDGQPLFDPDTLEIYSGSLPDELTWDSEWDSLAKIEAATGVDIIDSTELSSPENSITVAKSGGDYATVSDGVTAASAGDVVLVYPGTYTITSAITIEKPISVVGIDREKCIIQREQVGVGGAGYINAGVFGLNASGVNLANLTIKNTGDGYDEVGGTTDATMALVASGGSGVIENCYIGANGGRDILSILYNSDYTFRNCTVEQYQKDSIASHPVWVCNSASLKMERCIISILGSGGGPQIDTTGDVSFNYCSINANLYFLDIDSCDVLTILYCNMQISSKFDTENYNTLIWNFNKAYIDADTVKINKDVTFNWTQPGYQFLLGAGCVTPVSTDTDQNDVVLKRQIGMGAVSKGSLLCIEHKADGSGPQDSDASILKLINNKGEIGDYGASGKFIECISKTSGESISTFTVDKDGNISASNGVFTSLQNTAMSTGIVKSDPSGNIFSSALSDSDIPNNIIVSSDNLEGTATQWRSYSAMAAVGQNAATWSVNTEVTCLLTSTDGAVCYFPLDFGPGTILTRVRVKYKGATSPDGVKVRLVKRDESGTSTGWTAVGSQQTYTNNAVTVSTYDFADETISGDCSYAIEVESVVTDSETRLYSVGIETSKRVY